MCDTNEYMKTKIDKLTNAMNRLAAALEKLDAVSDSENSQAESIKFLTPNELSKSIISRL